MFFICNESKVRVSRDRQRLPYISDRLQMAQRSLMTAHLSAAAVPSALLSALAGRLMERFLTLSLKAPGTRIILSERC
jgi:hypothetical protein